WVEGANFALDGSKGWGWITFGPDIQNHGIGIVLAAAGYRRTAGELRQEFDSWRSSQRRRSANSLRMGNCSRLPSSSCFGQYLAAIVSLMMAMGVARSRSSWVKSRPSTN